MAQPLIVYTAPGTNAPDAAVIINGKADADSSEGAMVYDDVAEAYKDGNGDLLRPNHFIVKFYYGPDPEGLSLALENDIWIP